MYAYYYCPSSPPSHELMDYYRTLYPSDMFYTLLNSNQTHSFYRVSKTSNHRSNKHLSRKESFLKILNTSSSNYRIIPSSIKNDSSRENSRHVFETENSNYESFHKSFKKKLYDVSFSVYNTVRDSSSSFSGRSDSRSVHNILPEVYQDEEPMHSEKKQGCNCKKSKCLKLYCECFQKKLYCTGDCNCHSCGNRTENVEEHNEAVLSALARNPHGFEEESTQHNPEQKGFSLGIQPEEVRKGCKCKKTKCIKKYCECYQNGLGCSVFCRCEGCFNTDFQNSRF